MHEPHEHENTMKGVSREAECSSDPPVCLRTRVDILPLPARPPWYARRVQKLHHLAMQFAEAGLCRQLAGEMARGPEQLPERLRIAPWSAPSTRAPAFDKREASIAFAHQYWSGG